MPSNATLFYSVIPEDTDEIKELYLRYHDLACIEDPLKAMTVLKYDRYGVYLDKYIGIHQPAGVVERLFSLVSLGADISDFKHRCTLTEALSYCENKFKEIISSAFSSSDLPKSFKYISASEYINLNNDKLEILKDEHDQEYGGAIATDKVIVYNEGKQVSEYFTARWLNRETKSINTILGNKGLIPLIWWTEEPESA